MGLWKGYPEGIGRIQGHPGQTWSGDAMLLGHGTLRGNTQHCGTGHAMSGVRGQTQGLTRFTSGLVLYGL